jgi:hypothetical protein
LSLDAPHDNDTDDTDDPDCTNPDGTLGADVSGHATVCPTTLGRPDTFPAASNASTANV